MKTVKLTLTDAQLAAIQKVTTDAEKTYCRDIGVQATILAALTQGLDKVAYEVANAGQPRKLRLVK